MGPVSKEFSSRSLEEVSVHTILVLESHLLRANDEAGSNSVDEEVANEVAVAIAYFIMRFILFHT